MNDSRYSVKIACGKNEVEKALRLRYKVFVEEDDNKKLACCEKFERDVYDESCEHIIVLDSETGECVATCRLLSGIKASEKYGFYSENEFDLSAFKVDKREIVEFGRVCIDGLYRNGGILRLLFTRICEYLVNNDYKYAMGCAAAYFDNIDEISYTYKFMQNKRIVNLDTGISPYEENRIELNLDLNDSNINMLKRLPPLIRLYLKAGAYIASEPSRDCKFNSTHFLIMLPVLNLRQSFENKLKKILNF